MTLSPNILIQNLFINQSQNIQNYYAMIVIILIFYKILSSTCFNTDTINRTTYVATLIVHSATKHVMGNVS